MIVTILPENKSISVEAGTTVMDALRRAGIVLDAPCGGRGLCGKCKVTVVSGGVRREVQACRTIVDSDMTVRTHSNARHVILTAGSALRPVRPDGASGLAMAFDIGTTTVVGYLLDGKKGATLAAVSALNPQREYGADVISRIQYALGGGAGVLRGSIRRTLNSLVRQAVREAGADAGGIGIVSIVGNTSMHHLFLGLDCAPLAAPPFMPSRKGALTLPAAEVLDAAPNAVLRVLPNISGYVGADTVGCLLACGFGKAEPLTLMMDIGTNGEMVIGNEKRRIACSTAAGPAFEGAKITFGMRGAEGAIDHVFINDRGRLACTVIGGGSPMGLCGSGLLDAAAVLLNIGFVLPNGRICRPGEAKTALAKENAHLLTEYEGMPAVLLGGGAEKGVFLTQKDVREVQLAKGAIRAGVELMTGALGVRINDIRQVFLAGAFGNYLRPESACAIGMIPPALTDRIVPVGNAAGEGAKLAALSAQDFSEASRLAEGTEFLELASLPSFQDCFIDKLSFSEEEDYDD